MDICLLLLVVDDDVVISVVTHLSLSDQQESQWMVWCWLWCSIGNTIYAMMHYTPYAHHCCLFCLFVCLLSGECDPFDMPMLISVVHQLSGSIVFRIKTISHSLWYWPVIDIDRFWWREREREPLEHHRNRCIAENEYSIYSHTISGLKGARNI